MLKVIKSGGQLFLRINNSLHLLKNGTRTFLSEAYSCTDVWNRRFEVPLLQKVQLHKLFPELELKYNETGKISAVDVDVFANTVVGKEEMEELIYLLLKLRSCTETTNTLESTHHAVIRYFMKINEMEELFTILNDRVHYGIFPDYHCYNLLMDDAIKRKDFGYAAKIATLLMLQEDVGHPICNALSLYSCHKYLENPDDWKYVEEPPQEIEEEVFVRVGYLRNPYFDDHFDLREPRDLVGKTLAMQGKHLGSALGRSCQLRGLVLYKKYDAAEKLIKEWLSEVKGETVYENVFSLIEKDTSYIPEDQITEEFKALKVSLEELKKSELKSGNIEDDLKNYVEEMVKQHADEDIARYQQTYVEWHEQRIKVLEPELLEIHKQNKKEEFAKIKKELEDKERLLTFFDHEEEIELQIEELEAQKQQEEERLNPRAKIYRRRLLQVGDENYVSSDMKKAAKLQKIIDDNLAKIPK